MTGNVVSPTGVYVRTSCSMASEASSTASFSPHILARDPSIMISKSKARMYRDGVVFDLLFFVPGSNTSKTISIYETSLLVRVVTVSAAVVALAAKSVASYFKAMPFLKVRVRRADNQLSTSAAGATNGSSFRSAESLRFK